MNGILYITGALADGGVTTAKLADDAVTSAKIASQTIGAGDIANLAITTAKLNDAAVTTTKIADSQITTAKINDQAVTSAKIASDAVHSGKIADDAVGTEHIQDQAITSPLIAPNAVVTAKLADDAVTLAKMANDSVSASQIINNAVTVNALAADAVTTPKIADQAVTLAKLPHGTSSNNGKFLRANNGADPTFESIPASGISNLVEDTTPQLGGDLQSNGHDIHFGDSGSTTDDNLYFGDGNDLRLYHASGVNFISGANSANIYIQADDVALLNQAGNKTSIWCNSGGSVDLMHDNSKKFETTSYGTKVTGYQSSSSYVGFHVKGTNQDHGYGESHGSGITTYDVSYYSPIPMFSSKTIDYGSSYLSFPSYAGGNYIKFTAPVAGLYFLQLIASIETHYGGDWAAIGWEVNTTTANSSSDLMNNGRGAMVSYERVNTDTGMGTNLSTVLHLSANDYVVLYQQSSQAIRWKGNQYFVRGHLVH